LSSTQENYPVINSITGMILKTNQQIGGNEMVKKQLLGVLVVFAIFAFCGAAIAADSMTIVGTINEDGVLVDEGGTLYMLGEDEKGAAVADNAGKKVEVMGTVEEASDGTKTITVESYKVMEE
jgi:predicted lipoprotein with Yx(FWY)xxD motif